MIRTLKTAINLALGLVLVPLTAVPVAAEEGSPKVATSRIEKMGVGLLPVMFLEQQR